MSESRRPSSLNMVNGYTPGLKSMLAVQIPLESTWSVGRDEGAVPRHSTEECGGACADRKQDTNVGPPVF